ncbi:MAG: hypothetical protein VYB81_18805 [Pseudomonadota bacterium]|nr:hypothetical protein [Pseudomonadota bacterium]
MERLEENQSDYLDNRHNNDPILNDIALDEINFYISKYTLKVTKFEGRKKTNERITLISLVLLLITATLIYSPFLFGIDVLDHGVFRLIVSLLCSTSFITLFVSYLVNRLKGYTRAWSRNRLMKEQLELLAREYRLSINGKKDPTDKQYIKNEQANVLSKLLDLEQKNRVETHADIVGDYIATHEGVFGWVKGIRK